MGRSQVNYSQARLHPSNGWIYTNTKSKWPNFHTALKVKLKINLCSSQKTGSLWANKQLHLCIKQDFVHFLIASEFVFLLWRNGFIQVSDCMTDSSTGAFNREKEWMFLSYFFWKYPQRRILPLSLSLSLAHTPLYSKTCNCIIFQDFGPVCGVDSPHSSN